VYADVVDSQNLQELRNFDVLTHEKSQDLGAPRVRERNEVLVGFASLDERHRC